MRGVVEVVDKRGPDVAYLALGEAYAQFLKDSGVPGFVDPGRLLYRLKLRDPTDLHAAAMRVANAEKVPEVYSAMCGMCLFKGYDHRDYGHRTDMLFQAEAYLRQAILGHYGRQSDGVVVLARLTEYLGRVARGEV